MNEELVLNMLSHSGDLLSRSGWLEANRILNAREENLVETLILSYTDLEAIFNSEALDEMENPDRIKDALLRILR